MEHLVGLVGVAIVLFASTNVDDVFVLLGFFSDPKYRGSQVIIGQYVGIAVLFGVSVLASLVSLVVPAEYIGLLGLVPIFLGLKKLWDMRRGTTEDEADEQHKPAPGGFGSIVAVAAVTIANGGDNISIYTPLFATRSLGDIAVIGIVFACMTAAWLAIAHFLTNHPTIGAPIRRYGHRVVPYVLIVLGALILYEAETIRLILPALGSH